MLYWLATRAELKDGAHGPSSKEGVGFAFSGMICGA